MPQTRGLSGVSLYVKEYLREDVWLVDLKVGRGKSDSVASLE